MALVVEARNPDDGTTTYDQVEFHRATASGGTFTLQSTVTIDTTTITDLSPGYTAWTDSSGTTSLYYKARWKASSSGAVSSLSDEFQGGTTILDTRFRRMMRDTNSANYFFTNDDVANFRKDAIFSLWPGSWHEAIDESLTSSDTTEKYNIPAGVTRINKMQLIDSDGRIIATPKDYELVGRQIIFGVGLSNGYTIRLWVEKMFLKAAEVPETFDSYLLDFMMLQAYRVFEADRSKYFRYNTVAKPEGGNLPSIFNTIKRLEESTNRRLNALRRTRKPSEIGMQG